MVGEMLMMVQSQGLIGDTSAAKRSATELAHEIQTTFPTPTGWPLLRAIPDPRPNLFGAFAEVMGATMKFPAKAEIYGAGEPAEYVYQVVCGTIRTSRFLLDGRRQIGGFYLPGDIFGLAAADDHAYSAE